uniref:Uncharacterized protein n=1 Tax=Micrurus carvalhoi TaxID=3147026 RepID=A0A2H6MUP1_9SAUR
MGFKYFYHRFSEHGLVGVLCAHTVCIHMRTKCTLCIGAEVFTQAERRSNSPPASLHSSMPRKTVALQIQRIKVSMGAWAGGWAQQHSGGENRFGLHCSSLLPAWQNR